MSRLDRYLKIKAYQELNGNDLSDEEMEDILDDLDQQAEDEAMEDDD